MAMTPARRDALSLFMRGKLPCAFGISFWLRWRAIGYAAPAAAATTYDVELTGQIASGGTSTFTSGGTAFTIFSLALDGFDTPFDLAVGDVLNLTVTLDGLVNVPASGLDTFFGIDARTSPSQFALLDPGQISSGSVSPLAGTYVGQTFSSSCGNCISASASLGATPAFQVGSLFATIMIDSLSLFDPDDTSPVTLNGFDFRYQVSSSVAAVPEPKSWAAMLLGFGLVGATLRRRRGIALPA